MKCYLYLNVKNKKLNLSDSINLILELFYTLDLNRCCFYCINDAARGAFNRDMVVTGHENYG